MFILFVFSIIVQLGMMMIGSTGVRYPWWCNHLLIMVRRQYQYFPSDIRPHYTPHTWAGPKAMAQIYRHGKFSNLRVCEWTTAWNREVDLSRDWINPIWSRPFWTESQLSSSVLAYGLILMALTCCMDRWRERMGLAGLMPKTLRFHPWWIFGTRGAAR